MYDMKIINQATRMSLLYKTIHTAIVDEGTLVESGKVESVAWRVTEALMEAEKELDED